MSCVQIVIGAQVRESELVSSGVDLTVDELGRCPVLGNQLLFRDPETTWAYLCTFSRLVFPSEPARSDPTVIYQNALGWDNTKLQEALEPLGLWNSGQFGLWVLTRR